MNGPAPGLTAKLKLAPHPTSPKAARRRVVEILEAGPMAELAETASLLVSEVVTNAVLHAATEIELVCKVDEGSVCIEVRDRSPLAPSLRHYDPTASTGRGLGMVELLADEWGVDADERGKAVWFLLAGSGAGSTVPRIPSSQPPEPPGSFDVCLGNLPVDLAIAAIQYGDAVLREVLLLSIAAQDGTGQDHTRPVSKIDLGPLLARLEEAQAAGVPSMDLVLPFPDGAGATALDRLALVDEADRMARDGELLTTPAVPEIGACRRWLFGQISLQAEGGPPSAWHMPDPADAVANPVVLPEEERHELEARPTAAIVADDANRIVYANPAAAELLGWGGDELIGRRLVSIVPPELRASHLAGFTRYLLTGETRILDQPTRLPALRRDGSTVDVEVTIKAGRLSGRQVFRASLRGPRG